MTEATDPPPFGLSRRERILDELRRIGSVRVADLARDFGVAELTIRRDIGHLADRGLLTRVHGGATLRSRLDTTVPMNSSMGAQVRFRVGMVVPSLSYYWPEVIIGARSAATERGVQLALRGASYSVEDQRRQIATLVDSGSLHGLITATETAGADGQALLHWLEALPIPVVLAERRVAVVARPDPPRMGDDRPRLRRVAGRRSPRESRSPARRHPHLHGIADVVAAATGLGTRRRRARARVRDRRRRDAGGDGPRRAAGVHRRAARALSRHVDHGAARALRSAGRSACNSMRGITAGRSPATSRSSPMTTRSPRAPSPRSPPCGRPVSTWDDSSWRRWSIG